MYLFVYFCRLGLNNNRQICLFKKRCTISLESVSESIALYCCSSLQSRPRKNPITLTGFWLFRWKASWHFTRPLFTFTMRHILWIITRLIRKSTQWVFSRRCVKLTVESSADTVDKLNCCCYCCFWWCCCCPYTTHSQRGYR